jgi:ubiquinone/menaquinone biosynthesis C-methylase UbiE
VCIYASGIPGFKRKYLFFSCDINAAMLEVGKKRAAAIGFTSQDLSWQEGDAQELPFEDNTFDAYTISFGIRNVVDVQKVSLKNG